MVIDVQEIRELLAESRKGFAALEIAIFKLADAVEELENRTESLRPSGQFFDETGNLRDNN